MSDKPKDGGAAFAAACGLGDGSSYEWEGGMSVRTWLAGQALAGIGAALSDKTSSEMAVRRADFTMRELGLTGGGG